MQILRKMQLSKILNLGGESAGKTISTGNSEGRVRAQIAAPNANKVQLDIGG